MAGRKRCAKMAVLNLSVLPLSGLLKIKLRAHGLRVVYQLIRMNHQMLVIVIGIRADGQVYSEAQERMDKLK